MSDRPAFQFYPKDWRNNAKLRRCSPAARGVWVDLLCLLHDSDEYGVLRWPLRDIAQAAGASMAHVRELVEKDVLKGSDRGAEPYIHTPRHAGKDGEPVTLVPFGEGACWYCSRFVRDEWLRQRRGSGTRFDSTNQPPSRTPKASPTRRVGEPQGDGPSSASASAEETSEAKASDAADAPAASKPKSPDEMAKAELWRAAVSVLEQGGCPASQCRTFMGKLVGDYTFPVVQQAVAAAVAQQPADAREYLKATCQRLKGDRKDPLTVPSNAAEQTKALLDSYEMTPEEKQRSAAARAVALKAIRPITKEAA